MAMNRSEKEAMIASLKEDLTVSEGSFVVGVKGLTVDKFESLRSNLRKDGGKLQVAKVRLMKRALSDVGSAQGLEEFLKEQVALVFAKENGPGIAKMLCEFAKKNEKSFDVLGGYMESSVFDQAGVKTIASLPSRDVLLAQLAAVINAPITQLHGSLHQLLAQLVYTLQQLEAQKK
jgi:large subunit ribosomal protein L10